MTVVRTEVDERVAVVTLDRPEARNALNGELLRALPDAMARADADDAVDVIVVTGADPAFCAGIDLKELLATGAEFSAPRLGPDRAAPPSGRRPQSQEMSLTGNWLPADEALLFGLVKKVVPHDELLPTAIALLATSPRATAGPSAPCSPPTNGCSPSTPSGASPSKPKRAGPGIPLDVLTTRLVDGKGPPMR